MFFLVVGVFRNIRRLDFLSSIFSARLFFISTLYGFLHGELFLMNRPLGFCVVLLCSGSFRNIRCLDFEHFFAIILINTPYNCLHGNI